MSLRLKIMGRREDDISISFPPVLIPPRFYWGRSFDLCLDQPHSRWNVTSLRCSSVSVFPCRSYRILSAASHHFGISDTRGINYKRMKSERSIGLYLLAFRGHIDFFLYVCVLFQSLSHRVPIPAK